MQAVLRQEFGHEAEQDDYEPSDEEKRCCEDASEPPSFSRVDLQQPAEAIARDFPDFPGASAALTCTLEAGKWTILLS